MSGIDPSSIPNRVTPQPENSLPKVVPSAQPREDGTAQQNASWQGYTQGGGDPMAGRRGHSDPAVSLSASFARLDLGTVLKGTVIGFDPSNQPIIKTDQGTFIIDAQDAGPALDLKANAQVELKIVAVDHVIAAQVTIQDGIRPATPLLVNLTLVGIGGVGVGGAGDGNGALGAAIAVPVSGLPVTTGGANAAALGDGLPLQYAPQPAQTALLTGVEKMPLLALEPSAFINPRGSAAEVIGAALQSAPTLLSGLPGQSQNQNLSSVPSPSALLTAEDGPVFQQMARAAAAPSAADPEMALLLPPAATALANAASSGKGPAALLGIVWPARVETAISPAAGPMVGPLPDLMGVSGASLSAAVGAANMGPASLFGKGDPLLVKLAGIELPPAALGSQPALSGEARQSGLPQAGLGVIALSPTSWRMTGEVIGIEILPAPENVAPPNSAPPPGAALPNAGAEEPSRLLRLATPVGQLAVQVTADLPVGSRLVIEVGKMAVTEAVEMAGTGAAGAAKLPAATGGAARALPLFAYLDHWPAIDNILSALGAFSPAVAAALQARLSGSPGNLGNAALFLAQALGLGGGGPGAAGSVHAAEQWLGRDVTAALANNGHQGLLADFKDDLSRMADVAKLSAPTDWKTLLLPVYDGRQSQALPVLIRNFASREDPGDGSEGDPKEASGSIRATRFVVDVSLSRLGPVQMDGLIKQRSFNLILRSEKPLSPVMRGEIGQIFEKALARNRFEGELRFQPGNPFPLTAADYLRRQGQGVGGSYNSDHHAGGNPGNIYA